METMMNKAERQTITNAVALALAEVNPSAGRLEGDEDNRVETRAVRLLKRRPVTSLPSPNVYPYGVSYNDKPVVCTVNCKPHEDSPWEVPMTYSQDVSVMVNATGLLHDWGHYVMMTWSNQHEAVVHLI